MSETKLQREANDLDLDMFRMVGRLQDFAKHLSLADREKLQMATAAISAARYPVRSEMHPDRREETE